MDIIKHITDGLYTEPEVVIPGFGKFIGERKPAYVEGDKIYPPSKVIRFVRDTKSFALDLAIRIAKKERVTEDEAAKAISEFVRVSNEKLKIGQSVVFEGIGIIAPTPEGELIFHQSQHSNLLPESFGLSPIEIAATNTAAKKTRSVATTEPSEKKRSMAWLWWTLAGVALLVMLLGIGWLYTQHRQQADQEVAQGPSPMELELERQDRLNRQRQDSLARLQTTDTLAKKQPEAQQAVKQPTKQQPVKQPENISATGNPDEAFRKHFRSNSHIYLIVGSFQSVENANQFQQRLTTEGYQAEVMPVVNGFYRVSIGRFPNAAAAISVFDKFAAAYPDIDIWAL